MWQVFVQTLCRKKSDEIEDCKMIKRIDKDHQRFRQIVKGAIRKDLKKYISHSELIGKKGRNIVSIPVPQIDIPRFKYGQQQMGGVGQGKGKPGTPIGVDPNGQQGSDKAGNQPGEHILEVDISLDELVSILADELELPRIQPKGKSNIVSDKKKYSSVRRVGPESLRHFKRTYREALKRQIISNTYDLNNPTIIPIREDKRYRSWKDTPLPETNAVVIYIMDVSGSMGTEQKEIVRTESFWINTWLKANYKGITTRYIVHDAAAHEVDEETFFNLRESGGTVISSAYKLASKIVKANYKPEDWNIYFFQFSDGDNWGESDSEICVKILREELVPVANLFAYGQVWSAYGSGQFIETIRDDFENEENVITSEIKDKEAIYESIKTFLGKGL